MNLMRLSDDSTTILLVSIRRRQESITTTLLSHKDVQYPVQFLFNIISLYCSLDYSPPLVSQSLLVQLSPQSSLFTKVHVVVEVAVVECIHHFQ